MTEKMKRYIGCNIWHYRKKGWIRVDIEVLVSKEIAEEDDPIKRHATVTVPIYRKFIEFSIPMTFEAGFILYSESRRSDYVGTLDDIICRIKEEQN